MCAKWYAQRGFTTESVRKARSWYLRFIPECGNLLDLGCGRGEFLESAASAGHQVLGLDHDTTMLDQVNEHPTHHGEALDYLQSISTHFDTITAFHVIEHFPVPEAAALVRLAADRLRPGGRLIIATPNPGSLPTITHEFWRDPTHVRPYDTDLIEYLTRESGLTTESSGLNPESELGLPVNLNDLKLEPPLNPEPSSRHDALATRWVSRQMADSAYGENLERTIHATADGLLHTRQELERIASLLHRFLEVAYEPSEIYVVARRSSG